MDETNLENIVVAAQSYYSKLEEQFFLKLENNSDKSNCWKSVCTNIIANANYSILIIAFILGKDYIFMKGEKYMVNFGFFQKEKKAADLLKVRGLIEDNISTERMSIGVKNQFKRFNDPQFAASELRKRLALKQYEE